MTDIPKIPQVLPPPSVVWVDQNGRLTTQAYDYLFALDKTIRDTITAIEDLDSRVTALEP